MNSKKLLNFSETFIKAELIMNVRDYKIEQRTVLINSSGEEIIIGDKKLAPWQSINCMNLIVPNAKSLLCLSLDTNKEIYCDFPFVQQVINKWSHVYDIFPLPHLKKTNLWRSKKDRIQDVEFNLWFAKTNTNCGLHNEHGFKEIHTQIYGIGRMQKYHSNNFDSLYEDVFMCPGFTHQPFYDEKLNYPWHQYFADTDCVWLAMEFPV